MAISDSELGGLYTLCGMGKIPITGGPSGALRSPIAITVCMDTSGSNVATPSTGVMSLTSIFITAGQTITNINYQSGFLSSESGGSHLWYALYDDGRGSSTAGQLALLGQTADQTGAATLAANTNLGLSLILPYRTTYSGLYYVGFMCVATGMPNLVTKNLGSSLAIQIGNSAGAFISGTAGSGLLNLAPNPSGAITATTNMNFAYVS